MPGSLGHQRGFAAKYTRTKERVAEVYIREYSPKNQSSYAMSSSEMLPRFAESEKSMKPVILKRVGFPDNSSQNWCNCHVFFWSQHPPPSALLQNASAGRMFLKLPTSRAELEGKTVFRYDPLQCNPLSQDDLQPCKSHPLAVAARHSGYPS